MGWRLIFATDRTEGRIAGLVRRSLREVLGFDLLHAWANRHRLRNADVVWTMTEWEWLALRCVGRILPRTRRPVIANSIWLFNEWEHKGALRRALIRWLARGPGVLTVHSDRYVPIARAALPGIPVERMYFGVTLDAGETGTLPVERVDDTRPIRVLAMGNDATRDWETFLAAFGNDPRFEVELVCAAVGPEQRARYGNLRPRTASAALARDEMRRMYAWSDVVVVPMVENRFSGITSAIDGCGYGKPVVATHTGGVPTYFEDGEVLFVPPGDASAMRDAVLLPPSRLEAVARAGRRRFERSDYSSHGMVARYIAFSRPFLPPSLRSAS